MNETPGNVPAARTGIVLTPAHRAFFRALPKVELHCHLLGAVRRETFIELAERTRAPIERAEIEAFYTRGEKPVGVLRVLRALDQHLLTRADDLRRLAYEYLEDAAAHNVRHSEFFWNPTGTVRVSGIAYADAQAAIVTAIRDAARDFGISARLIPSIDREADPDEAVQMVDWMKACRAEEVAGIGIDYRENDRPPELFWKAYREAREAGFRTTAHAGEFGMPWRNVETALELLRVDRLDHGYTIVDNPALAERHAARGTVFTVVPTNSYYLRTLPPEQWAERHPIRRMPGLGLKIHPNTDDPTLHKVNPSEAWELMHSHFGFGIEALREFMLNGIDGAWVDEATRQAWRADWGPEFDRLAAALATA
ncbi:adenosine deaminase [Burkholderia gladioli]|jgi:adenosine deaminase|uniref:adenosine deaminase n=1 Tax=Burkholderia gladioli TaxID=28095 RepID=UPI000CDA079D|nr:adenosine deaminase [Burkholderia gladioli]MBU9178626.1 adenosine deaminase [Burkholderia gladioli]MDC6132090.1 adenosine deaminase [Burkholderia gladioli]MDN7499415.1 adenosine deaminase [Burkholderia gladioli]NRF84514.1 adenosine deaminase [Burkholderia gladioli]POS04494.1 adenosine deaminase [Burkholderia gladioli]